MRNNSILVLCAVTAGMLSLFAGAVAETAEAAESPQESEKTDAMVIAPLDPQA